MNPIKLNEGQLDEIRKLAEEKRRSLGFIGETPIANDIFTILEKLNIKLLEYPIKSEGNRPAFSADIMYSEESDQKLTFIGLNTADFFDKQIFAIAHELYHFYIKSGSHLSRPDDDENNTIEVKANRFAAELLLPENVLKRIVLDEFRMSTLHHIHLNKLMRFIARLHCTWWLPYRSLVKRLHEIRAITANQYAELYEVNERELNGKFGKIGRAINEEVFLKLNKPTLNIGTSPNEIEIIIRNYEDNLIDEDKFEETLRLFNRAPADFGYEIEVSQVVLSELEEFFRGEDDSED